jgi:hypothetical protein
MKEYKKYPKICKVCNRQFEAGHPNITCCSGTCRRERVHLQYKRPVKLDKPFSIFHRDNFTCIYCGKSSIEDGVKLHVDHIYPVIKGGLHEPGNLITSCKNCNSSKGFKIFHSDIINRLLAIVEMRNKKLTNEQLILVEAHVEDLRAKFNDRKKFIQLFSKYKRVRAN